MTFVKKCMCTTNQTDNQVNAEAMNCLYNCVTLDLSCVFKTLCQNFCIPFFFFFRDRKWLNKRIRSAASRCLFGRAAAEVGVQWEKSSQCVYIRKLQPAFTKLKPGGRR